MKKVFAVLILGMLFVSCTAERREAIHERLLQLRIVGDKVIIRGCDAAAKIDLAVTEIRPYLAEIDDPKIQAAGVAYDLNKPVAIEICKYVRAKLAHNQERLERL